MDFFQSSRQKKHNSAIQKTKHKPQKISKRTIEFSKEKGAMKVSRRLEYSQKQSGCQERTFFCNVCKKTYINQVCRCDYVEWCGSKSKFYDNCLYGLDMCEYHTGNYNNFLNNGHF